MSMTFESPDGHAGCDWRDCGVLATVPLQISLRPPGSAVYRDVIVRLCAGHAGGISLLCPDCGGAAMSRETGVSCARCGGLGMIARDGAILQIDWSLIEAAREGLNPGAF